MQGIQPSPPHLVTGSDNFNLLTFTYLLEWKAFSLNFTDSKRHEVVSQHEQVNVQKCEDSN